MNGLILQTILIGKQQKKSLSKIKFSKKPESSFNNKNNEKNFELKQLDFDFNEITFKTLS